MITFLIKPSKLAKVVTLVTCIWEVPSSNLIQDSDYPVLLLLLLLSSVPPSICYDSTFNYVMTDSFSILSNSLFAYHPIFQHYIVQVTDSIVK
jgi:hypothetical protein